MNIREQKLYKQIQNNIKSEKTVQYNVNQLPNNVLSKLKKEYKHKTYDFCAAEAVYITLISFNGAQ